MMLPETTPIENVVDIREFADAYMAFSRSLPRPRDLVTIHKTKLGRQTTTYQAAEHRLWVWVRPAWTIYVGNAKGVEFEVPEDTSPEKAWEAWWDYLKAMGFSGRTRE